MKKKIAITDLERLPESMKMAGKRQVRADILKAWDIYSKNVAYGVESEDPTKHILICSWFQSLKDLDDWAFENIPEEIKKYM